MAATRAAAGIAQGETSAGPRRAGAPFLRPTVDHDPEAVRKHLRVPISRATSPRSIEALEPLVAGPVTMSLETNRARASWRGRCARHQGGNAHSRRTYRGDRQVGEPGIFEVLALVGKPRTLSRLRSLQARTS